MLLHRNKDLFENLIKLTANNLNIDNSMVEKDYFAMLFLKELYKVSNNIVLKGGTSLSKCYKIINRFSEDIDISLENDKDTESVKKILSHNIKQIISEQYFNLENENKIWSNSDYNKYLIDYKPIFKNDYVNEYLIIETSTFIKSYPHKINKISTFIYDYIKRTNYEMVSKYMLEPFEIKVQNLERTFIDKIYALCDYYILDKINEHSRHIYDLYMLLPYINLDSSLSKLAFEVKKLRSIHKQCPSAKDGIDINKKLSEIVKRNIYENDYNKITYNLLYKKVKYSDAIKVINKIIEYNFL